MLRLVARLVTLAAALALAAGCAPELPKEIYADDAFTADEEAMLVEMIDEWNRVGREYLGREEILIYRGRFSDANGFDPDDLGDDHSVIYRGTEDQYYEYLDGSGDDGLTLLGYGTTADVLLFTFQLADEQAFRHVALHELGHFLGLGHVPDDTTAVMYYLTGADPPIRLNRTDLQDFCLVYSCIRQP